MFSEIGVANTMHIVFAAGSSGHHPREVGWIKAMVQAAKPKTLDEMLDQLDLEMAELD